MKKFFSKIEYNSPLVLTFALLAAGIFLLDTLLPISLTKGYFVYYGGVGLLDFIRLLTWPLGHASLDHLMGNLTLLLLIGPLLEEKYASKTLLFLMLVTTLLIGLIHGLFFDGGILGASGIVFMLIILTSYTNSKKGKLPLTFIVISLLFLGKEVYHALFLKNNVSELSHLIGGFIGIVFVNVQSRKNK